MSDLLESALNPRSVAVIGASENIHKIGGRPIHYMRKHGFAGRIIPINPGRDTVLGERAYKRVADYPGQVDHALIMVEDVERALEDCGRSGVQIGRAHV